MTPDTDPPWRRLRLSYPSVTMNLAAEEAIARGLASGVQTQPTVRLWTNPKSAIVGRFQEVAAEVDLDECKLNKVEIARRFTGGGTVFHDENTLNLTLVAKPKESRLDMTFQDENIRLVNNTLNDLGASCTVEGNAILFNNRKVCGTAAAVSSGFLLWHCSILVDTDTHLLELVLAPSRLRTKSRYVRSRWREVTNIATALGRLVNVEELASRLEENFAKRANLEAGELTAEEGKHLEQLYTQKYSLRDWNINGNYDLPQRLRAEGSHNDCRMCPLNTLD